MSLFADVLRPFWLKGLNEVSGRQIKEIAGWVSDEGYQLYSEVGPKSFTLDVSDATPLIRAFAAELDRIASASFETVSRIELSAKSKSIAWQCIQLYYAAFFSAHAILRVFGTGCNTFGRTQVNSVLKVASAWGVACPSSLPGGLYAFSYHANRQQFSAKHVIAAPHESFWRLFDGKIAEIADSVLGSQANFTADVRTRQAVALKLGQLRTNLSWIGPAQATWLTYVRNGINYEHKWAAWWPYAGRPKYYKRLSGQSGSWKDDPFDLELSQFDDRDILRFQATCNFLISVCRDTLQQLAERCSSGDSFLSSGTIAYWNMTGILKERDGHR